MPIPKKAKLKLQLKDKKVKSPLQFFTEEEKEVVIKKILLRAEQIIGEIVSGIKNGEDGAVGERGKRGETGGKGKPGEKGGIGEQGKEGKTGKTGESVAISDILEVIEPELDKLRRRVQQSKSGKWGGGDSSIPFTTVSTDTTIVVNSKVHLVDATNGDVTVTLPPASQAARREYHVKKTDSTSNAVKVLPVNSETIDGEICQEMIVQFTSLRLYSDGSNWHLI